jgi:hypothetical protein
VKEDEKKRMEKCKRRRGEGGEVEEDQGKWVEKWESVIFFKISYLNLFCIEI